MTEIIPGKPCADGAPPVLTAGAERSAAFTPGPWRIEGRRGAGYIISAGVNSYGDGPEAYVGVLDPLFHIAGEKTDELHANALLVAAAPEWRDAARALTTALADERDYTIAMRKVLAEAREYVTDALDAHEHSDGRELLGWIDSLLAPDVHQQPRGDGVSQDATKANSGMNQ